MKNNYYFGTYIPGIVKQGEITLLPGVLAGLLPALVMALRGYMSPVSAIVAGTLTQISVSGVFYIAEPIPYFPILGISRTYLTLLSSSTSNMRVPCFPVAQEAAGVEMGVKESSIISAAGIATSILVNIVIPTVGVIARDIAPSILPVPVKGALNSLLPALFGAVFRQFAATRPELSMMTVIIAVRVNWLMELGFLNFIPDNPSYVVILVIVFDSIHAGKLPYKKELQAD